MNNTITADDLDALRHMLGATVQYPRKSWGFRNHYVGETPGMRRLVAAGFAVRRTGSEITGGDPVFHATREGKRAVGMTDKEIARSEKA